MPDENDQNGQVTIEQLQADLDQAMNGWRRAQADFENFKKQKERENKELLEFAKEVTVVRLLPTLDALEQALRHMPTEENQEVRSKNQGFFDKYQNWQTGVNGIVAQLDKV